MKTTLAHARYEIADAVAVLVHLYEQLEVLRKRQLNPRAYKDRTMRKKPDFTTLQFFLAFCKAKREGMSDLRDAILEILHNHGFDVKEIQGKWCLVEYDKGGDGR